MQTKDQKPNRELRETPLEAAPSRRASKTFLVHFSVAMGNREAFSFAKQNFAHHVTEKLGQSLFSLIWSGDISGLPFLWV